MEILALVTFDVKSVKPYGIFAHYDKQDERSSAVVFPALSVFCGLGFGCFVVFS